jgi:hypothetical protein
LLILLIVSTSPEACRGWLLRLVPITVRPIGVLPEVECPKDGPEVKGQTRLQEVPHQGEDEADHETEQCPHDDLRISLEHHDSLRVSTSRPRAGEDTGTPAGTYPLLVSLNRVATGVAY